MPINLKGSMTLLVMFIVGALHVQAQENQELATGLFNWTLKAGDVATVLADTAYIRSSPATTGEVVKLLTAGSGLIFLEDEQRQTVRGFSAPWARVRFVDKGVAKEGYIWRGLLALGCIERSGLRFAYGLERAVMDKEQTPSLIARLAVLDSTGTTLSVRKWTLSSTEATNFSEAKVLGNMGLDSLTAIIRICFSGEACAIPTDYYYFGWTGAKLLPMPGRTDISDAGVFYHEEQLLFPSEKGGKPGMIVKVIRDEEALEETDKNGEPLMKTSNAKEVYKWDGVRAVKL